MQEFAIESLVRFVPAFAHAVDWYAVVHTQPALYQLIEIRPVCLAESVIDDKRLVMILVCIEIIIPVYAVARRIEVHVRGIQIEKAGSL